MKRLQLLLMLVFLAIGAWAQQITEQQAMDRALQFLNTNKAAKARGLDGKQLKLEAAEVEANSIYAFNLEGGGYVIASGDSRALPVLGYSDKGTIDWKQIPSNMRAWLKSYDQVSPMSIMSPKSKIIVDGTVGDYTGLTIVGPVNQDMKDFILGAEGNGVGTQKVTVTGSDKKKYDLTASYGLWGAYDVLNRELVTSEDKASTPEEIAAAKKALDSAAEKWNKDLAILKAASRQPSPNMKRLSRRMVMAPTAWSMPSRLSRANWTR